jgi:GNAT superfamily N-acetyltransferase
MALEVIEVFADKGIGDFIDFPHELYKDDPHYVPEIYIGQKDMHNPKKFPFFLTGSARYYLAKRDGVTVGRIACINHVGYNEHFGSSVGFFGFCDFVDDKAVSKALLFKASEYARACGHFELMGPTNFTTNDTAGALVDGFDGPPKIMMTYNKSYYNDHYEAFGLAKEMDLYAYNLPTSTVSDKSIRLAAAIEERLKAKGITIRNINMKKLDQEAQLIKAIYNSAWINNWGFVPFTEAEFEYLKNDLKMIVDAKFVWIAEHEGKAVGFGLTLPNINEVLIKNKRGRLFPWGIFRLLFGKKKVKSVRVIALGVLEDYRKMGIESLFFAKKIERARTLGLTAGEASWVLESNQEMVAAAERMGGIRYRTYRLYKKRVV